MHFVELLSGVSGKVTVAAKCHKMFWPFGRMLQCCFVGVNIVSILILILILMLILILCYLPGGVMIGRICWLVYSFIR